jgi:hypothetical protein
MKAIGKDLLGFTGIIVFDLKASYAYRAMAGTTPIKQLGSRAKHVARRKQRTEAPIYVIGLFTGTHSTGDADNGGD